MTDNPNEGNVTVSGVPSANSPASQNATTPLSGDLTSLVKQVSDLSKLVTDQEKMIRSLQSGKDKAVDRIEQNLAKYLGVEPEKVEEARRKMALDELLDERLGKREHVATGTSAQPQAKDEVQSIVAELGLQENDPRVVDVLTKKLSPVQTAIALAKLQSTATLPTDAQRPPVAGQPQRPDNVAQLTAEYKQKVLSNRGKASVIQSLRKEYAEKGVDVDHVVFSL